MCTLGQKICLSAQVQVKGGVQRGLEVAAGWRALSDAGLWSGHRGGDRGGNLSLLKDTGLFGENRMCTAVNYYCYVRSN